MPRHRWAAVPAERGAAEGEVCGTPHRCLHSAQLASFTHAFFAPPSPLPQAALDRGLEALRLLNTSYAAQLAEMRSVRQERGDRTGVHFSVGQVFIHKKVGGRGRRVGERGMVWESPPAPLARCWCTR